MARYALKRLLQAIPLLLGIAVVTFAIIHVAPGDPIDALVGPNLQGRVDPARIDLLREKYGLGEPIHVQLWRWLADVAQGNFGRSFRYDRPVAGLLAERLPYTLQLMGLAFLLDLTLGIALGVLSAVKQYSLLDRSITLGSLLLYSIPGFWLAVVLVLVFAEHLGWLPASQPQSVGYQTLGAWAQFWDRLRHLMLPAFVLGVSSAAATARYMRNRLLDVLSKDYVLAARARGLSERVVVLKHALRNALGPVATKVGLSLPMLLGGAVLIEEIFAWPGMGRLAVEAVRSRDVPVILATTMLSGVLVVGGSLLADIAYAALDPRVSYEERQASGA